MTETPAAIASHSLSKHFGDFRALDELSLNVPRNCVFGLLGPNGAGKSTWIRLLLGFLRPTAGHAEVLGFDTVRDSLNVRSQVAYMPAGAKLYGLMRGDKVLRFFADLHPLATYEQCCEVAIALDLDLSRRVMWMSTGMRQKLALAITFGCRAPMLILDEPTSNVDPNVRAAVMEQIRLAKKRGQTILLSSHIFEDIDEVCDQVAILRAGKLVAEQSMHELSQSHVVQLRGSARDIIERLSTADLPTFASWIDTGAEQRKLLLQGEPSVWLSWLNAQGDAIESIQRSSVETIYRLHHRQPIAKE